MSQPHVPRHAARLRLGQPGVTSRNFAHRLQLRCQLGSGVTRAHHDERAASGSFVDVLGGVDPLELAQNVVSQGDCLR
jgi:hypothetical protein